MPTLDTNFGPVPAMFSQPYVNYPVASGTNIIPVTYSGTTTANYVSAASVR